MYDEYTLANNNNKTYTIAVGTIAAVVCVSARVHAVLQVAIALCDGGDDDIVTTAVQNAFAIKEESELGQRGC